MACVNLVGILPGTEWPHWMHWTFDVQLGIKKSVKTTAEMLSCGLIFTCSRVHKEASLGGEAFDRKLACFVFFFFFRRFWEFGNTMDVAEMRTRSGEFFCQKALGSRNLPTKVTA